MCGSNTISRFSVINNSLQLKWWKKNQFTTKSRETMFCQPRMSLEGNEFGFQEKSLSQIGKNKTFSINKENFSLKALSIDYISISNHRNNLLNDEIQFPTQLLNLEIQILFSLSEKFHCWSLLIQGICLNVRPISMWKSPTNLVKLSKRKIKNSHVKDCVPCRRLQSFNWIYLLKVNLNKPNSYLYADVGMLLMGKFS